ncbi:MAG: lipoprotein-releasing ABC transporter permease subunit [Alphaproteobacteria bacterium]|jgi:lipoprotein-releasing system permease protein|nr:lipoprotein-releasing ABC transporter permease subunit [Alphaproteobacteria bacterium]
MFNVFERMVALRYLRARRKEGFISIIAGFSLVGIALGVATLIIVMAVMNGFRQELVDRVLGLNGHLNVYAAQGGPLETYDELVERVRQIDGVTTVTPTIEAQALVTHGEYASGAAVRGVPPGYLQARPELAGDLVGDPGAFAGPNAIAIGRRMANRLGVWTGDQLTLIAPQGNVTAFGTVPRMRGYDIVAIFEAGMYEYDNSFVYMPLDTAQIFYQMRDSVTTLELFVEDPDNLAPIRDQVRAALGGEARLWDWQQANSSFFTALQVERNVMFLILTLIILVAALNIISGLVMLVKDKGRDIAILRTMGATQGMVTRIFFLTGASIGVVGTLAGLGLGIAFTENIEHIQRWLEAATGTELWNPEIRFLTTMPAVIDWNEVIAVIGMALGLSFLATLYPAWRAARLDPVEALRYE